MRDVRDDLPVQTQSRPFGELPKADIACDSLLDP
jgi:hypothetical protein